MLSRSLQVSSLLVALATSALACSDSSSPSGESTEKPAPSSAGTTTPPPKDGTNNNNNNNNPQPPDLDPGDKGKTVPEAIAKQIEGTYAARMRVATVQDLPVLGKADSTAVTYGIAVITYTAGALTILESGCHVDIQSSGSMSTIVPDAIAQSVVPETHEFRAWQEGTTVKWARPLVASPVGAKLAAPATDTLPAKDDDARVWDQDKDGKPGVTVKVSGFVSGDIYVVQRQRSVLAGTVSATGDLAGLVADTSDQSVIGSSNPVLNQNIPSTTDPDSSKSNVIFVKDKVGLTCQDLLTRKDTIFAGKP